MKTFIYVILGIVFLIIFIGIIWRFYSSKMSIPCPSWLSWMVELDNPFAKTNRAAVIIEHLELKPGMKVLDAGCGPGRLTIPVAQKVGKSGEVTAMDIQAEMLSKIKKKAKNIDIDTIRFLHAGLGEGTLEKNYYDRALLVTVLGEIPDKMAALSEIFDVLKPGGLLLISETIFDPHYQRRKFVLDVVMNIGFFQDNFIGNWLGYNMLLKKPLILKINEN